MITNRNLLFLLAVLSLIATACSTDIAPVVETGTAAPSRDEATAAEAVAAEANVAEEAVALATLAAGSEQRLARNGKPLLDDEPARAYESYWKTDFSLHTVPYSEILSGGVPRDGIPPLDNPHFVSVTDAATWLVSQEPVFVVTVNGETRAYPLQILTWHEIVNDTLGGEPIMVTFCPLCNSAITFERMIDGTVYDFGVSGKLRNSDLIMWDRQTQSWWQQLTGEAVVGELVGTELTFLPTQLISFGAFKESFPEANVLSQNTGFSRPYGRNPYAGYDNSRQPFLFDGTPDSRLLAMDRVVAVDIAGEVVAYPYPVLAEAHVVADTVGGTEIVVFWQAGTTSALDAGSIADSRDVGAAAVYRPLLDGRTLTFRWNGQSIIDEQAGTTWNILGQGVKGALAGEQLEPVIHANHFWFAWAAFKPETRIYSGAE